MVIIGGSIYVDKILKGRIPHVSFSNSTGTTFSDPESVEIDPTIVSWGDWIWRVTWHKGIGYGIDYQVGPDERKGPTSLFSLKHWMAKSTPKFLNSNFQDSQMRQLFASINKIRCTP